MDNQSPEKTPLRPGVFGHIGLLVNSILWTVILTFLANSIVWRTFWGGVMFSPLMISQIIGCWVVYAVASTVMWRRRVRPLIVYDSLVLVPLFAIGIWFTAVVVERTP